MIVAIMQIHNCNKPFKSILPSTVVRTITARTTTGTFTTSITCPTTRS